MSFWTIVSIVIIVVILYIFIFINFDYSKKYKKSEKELYYEESYLPRTEIDSLLVFEQDLCQISILALLSVLNLSMTSLLFIPPIKVIDAIPSSDNLSSK